MAYFAVIKDNASPIQDFEVLACHLNLWCLPGLLQRNFYFDVGLQIKPIGNTNLTTFHLAIPFGTEFFKDSDKVDKDGLEAPSRNQVFIEDLKDQILVDKNAQLVFGSQVDVKNDVNNRHIYVDTEFDCEVYGIDFDSSKRSKKRSGRDYTYWTIKPDKAIPVGSTAYIRVRFDVFDLGKTWVWKRGGKGATIDFRVSDVRETVATPAWKDLDSRIASIKIVYLFIIAPTWLQQRAISPSLRYMRLLEADVWREYLKRNDSERKIIYYWRSEKSSDDSHKKVSASMPFRAFLELSREHFPSTPATALLAATFVYTGLVVYNNWETLLHAILLVASYIWFKFRVWLGIVGGVGVATFFVQKIPAVNKVFTFASYVKIQRKNLEDRLYKIK